MPKTIDELDELLRGHGYECKRELDVILSTQVPTSAYVSPTGDKFLSVCLTFDKCGDCVAVESLRAFDLRKTKHKEATLACLMTAAARTPLLRTSLDPADGEIRLRIDCTCGLNGARETDVLRAVALLPAFADAWFPEIAAAMTRGKYDPNAVAQMHVPKLRGRPAGAGKKRPAAPKKRAEEIGRKAGAGVNRLRVLLEFHQWLAAQPGTQPPSSTPGPADAAKDQADPILNPRIDAEGSRSLEPDKTTAPEFDQTDTDDKKEDRNGHDA